MIIARPYSRAALTQEQSGKTDKSPVEPLIFAGNVERMACQGPSPLVIMCVREYFGWSVWRLCGSGVTGSRTFHHGD